MIFIKSTLNPELNKISESIEITEEGIFQKVHNRLFGADQFWIKNIRFCGKTV